MQKDEEILSILHKTGSIYLGQDKGKFRYLMGLISLSIRILLLPSYQIVVCWFADYHAFVAVLLAKLSGKKAVIFIGGYDAVCYPEFEYGVFCFRWRRIAATFALKNCDLIVANHEALLESDNLYYNPSGHPEGVFRLVPDLKTPSRVIHNAVICPPPPVLNQNRKRQILCVGSTPRYQDFINKGFDLLLQMCDLFEDWSFVFVGIPDCWRTRLEGEYGLQKHPNLTVYPPLTHEKVLELMSESDIYVQPSISEGMPNALVHSGWLSGGWDTAGHR